MRKDTKHNINEDYLQSLTESERTKQMSEWSASEWQQYYCPSGTISLDEAMDYLKNKVTQIIQEKYGKIQNIRRFHRRKY